jgi:hypothetical protein
VKSKRKNEIMKTSYLKINWLIPLGGAAMIAGCLMAGTTYLGLERSMQADNALSATVERLVQDQEISALLRKIHNGEVEAAAEWLDRRLCGDVLRLNDELESADPLTRTYVQDSFRRIAVLRPKPATGAAAAAAPGCNLDRAAAERVLAQALGTSQIAQTR